MLLNARQTADRLGVKIDTLYAYVSRGRLRSVMVPGTRERRYRSEDVEALLDGRSGARPPRGSDPEALMPVIGSSVCMVENGRFYYRGQAAARLAGEATLEEIARLLWLDDAGSGLADLSTPNRSANVPAISGLIERCQNRLVALGDEDLPALDLTRARVARTGWRILGELASCVAPGQLSADPIHGGETERAEGLLRELLESDDPMAVMAGRLTRGERLPGFGQPLYPEGDPRATAILAVLGQAAPEAHALVEKAAETGLRLTGRHPNVDFALEAEALGLGLPRNTSLG